MVIGFLVLAYLFFVVWRGAIPWGVGTGSIGGRSEQAESTPATNSASGKGSALTQVATNPQKWEGKTVTVAGRVRGNTRYASNRNLYRLTDGESTLFIVDDKTPPKEYAWRSIKGEVKVLKPPVGDGYAYIVNVKGDPKIDLDWKEVQGFFTERIEDIKKGVGTATN